VNEKRDCGFSIFVRSKKLEIANERGDYGFSVFVRALTQDHRHFVTTCSAAVGQPVYDYKFASMMCIKTQWPRDIITLSNYASLCSNT